jgi:hypothetical protein
MQYKGDNMGIDWKRKLTSRKLWLAVAGFVSGIMLFCGASESEAAQVAALIMSGASVVGYMIGEGLADSNSVMLPPSMDD